MRTSIGLILLFNTLLVVSIVPSDVFAGAKSRGEAAQRTDNGPSIEQTMNFIRDKLQAEGEISFTDTIVNSNNSSSSVLHQSENIKNVIADVVHCTLSWTDDSTTNGTRDSDNYQLVFAGIEKPMVTSYDDFMSDEQGRGGDAEFVHHSSPLVTALVVRMKAGQRVTGTVRTAKGYLFLFDDADLANRVAKAFAHGADLCGGTSNEPF